jgi:hypothetical protein
MGYRAALEVLIKNYVRREYPTKQTKIHQKSIATCFIDYIADEKIKRLVEQNSLLLNHEVHSSPQHIARQSELKVYISILVHYIEMRSFVEKLKA